MKTLARRFVRKRLKKRLVNMKPGATFEAYILAVGIRSSEYTYDGHLLYENIEYFRRCRDAGLSPYKALLFLGDYLKGDYQI